MLFMYMTFMYFSIKFIYLSSILIDLFDLFYVFVVDFYLSNIYLFIWILMYLSSTFIYFS